MKDVCSKDNMLKVNANQRRREFIVVRSIVTYIHSSDSSSVEATGIH